MVIFFDLGDTLVVPRLDDTGEIAALDVLPFVPEVLDRLRMVVAPGVRLGLMSNTPSGYTLATMRALLSAAGIVDRFETDLLLFNSVEGVSKEQPSFFQRGATRADVPASQCIFVGEDASERSVARTVGFRVAYHPLHVFALLAQPS